MAGGRPRLYNSAEEVQEIVDKYFAELDDEIPTMAGLALELGMSSRSLRNYAKEQEFYSVIYSAKDRINNAIAAIASKAADVMDLMDNAASRPNGGFVMLDGGKLQNNDFPKESDLSLFIENNIKKFCAYLGYKHISHDVNVPINKRFRRSPPGRHVDLVVDCDGATLVVELKNPSSATESRAAIGQVLDYGREFPDTHKKELIIVTTRFDIHTARTIRHYGLPIRYIYMSKAETMEFIDEQVRKAA